MWNLNKCKYLKYFCTKPFELEYKKLLILRENMPIKSLKKINLRKKYWRDSSLGHANWYWGQKFFATSFNVYVLLQNFTSLYIVSL